MIFFYMTINNYLKIWLINLVGEILEESFTEEEIEKDVKRTWRVSGSAFI